MATRTCPNCEAQYVATVRRCIDCDVMLVDEQRAADASEPAPSGAAPVGDGDQVGYELEGWGNQLKVTLDGMLLRSGIGRVWEAGALVVAADHEGEVDELIATLEGDDLPELDDDTPRVALEIEGLDADGVADLDARLIADAVAHAWDDEGALVIAEADEEQVLAIIGAIFDADDDDADGDGLAAHQALSTLYVAVDRLLRSPHDRKLATAYVDAAADLDGHGVPYGFAAADWDALVAEAASLATAVSPYADPVVGEDHDNAQDRDEEADPDEAVAEDEPDEEPAKGGEPADDEEPQEGAEVADLAAEAEALEIERDAARALRTRLADLV